jgi:hypothetical protein
LFFVYFYFFFFFFLFLFFFCFFCFLVCFFFFFFFFFCFFVFFFFFIVFFFFFFFLFFFCVFVFVFFFFVFFCVCLGALSITNSKDILTAIAQSKGPEQFLIALGYAGWGAGQLEEELKSNTWLSCPASHTIIFSTPPEERRSAAARSLGIQLSRLSHLAGHS